MGNTRASSAPSPMRDSPDANQLTRDFDGELWDSMALEILEVPASGSVTLHTSETTDLILPYTAPVIFKTPFWCFAQIQVDTTVDPQDVYMSAALVARDATPTSFSQVARLQFPVSGFWCLPLANYHVESNYPGLYDLWVRITAGLGAPDVTVNDLQAFARSGRIPPQ